MGLSRSAGAAMSSGRFATSEHQRDHPSSDI